MLFWGGSSSLKLRGLAPNTHLLPSSFPSSPSLLPSTRCFFMCFVAWWSPARCKTKRNRVSYWAFMNYFPFYIDMERQAVLWWNAQAKLARAMPWRKPWQSKQSWATWSMLSYSHLLLQIQTAKQGGWLMRTVWAQQHSFLPPAGPVQGRKGTWCQILITLTLKAAT